MSTIGAFSADYFTARRRFREAVSRLGWELETHGLNAASPNDEPLTIDVARFTNVESADTLVISSGLHGVEGFFGAAVQLGLIEGWTKNAATIPRMNVVLLHALNPFGFAWLRRFNEANVDLNRNFLLPGERFEGCPEGYAELNPLFNPAYPPRKWDPFLPKALLAIAKNRGISKIRQALAAGQYKYPKGLFYGGSEPTQTPSIVAKNLPRWIGGSSRVIHLDFHTGLGDRATWKLLIDYPLNDGQKQRLTDWFGKDAWQHANSDGIAHNPRGSVGQWCVNMHKDIDYMYACAEFGTYGNITVSAKLRAENQAHHWGDQKDSTTISAKQQLLEVFCPRDERWRQTVLNESYRLVEVATKRANGGR